MTLCYNCFKEKTEGEEPCPHCGFDLSENVKKYPVALRAGTLLNGRYLIGRVLGQGGFGITYLAYDQSLKARVAVKEYMPNDMAARVGTTVSVAMKSRAEDFAYGLERFQEEARTLAKFMGQPGIAGVTDYFDENDTSYFVMDYIEGISFKTYIANAGGKVSVQEALDVMIPVLRALTAVHAEGFIHRDVTPDNIYITKDGNVKLLDFGSARYSLGDKSKSLDVVLKVGYAPKEQYTRRGRQGPYTDVYSCAACLYAAITGYLPPESLERLDKDTLVPPSQAGVEIPLYLERAILKGLAVQPEDRFQTAGEFLEALESQRVVELPGGQKKADGMDPGRESQAVPKKSRLTKLAGAAAGAAVVFAAVALIVSRNPSAGSGGERGSIQENAAQEFSAATVLIAGEEYPANLEELDLSGKNLTDSDLANLEQMTGLKTLNLEGNPEIRDLTPISGLTSLEHLELPSPSQISDLSPLSGLRGLTSLSVGESFGSQQPVSQIQDYSPLAGLTGLKELSLSVTNISDFSFLEGMKELETLRLMGSMVTGDLTFAKGLTNLKELRVVAGSLGSVKGIEGLQNLEYLQISDESEQLFFDDLIFVAEMGKLQTLRLNGAGLGSFQGAENLTELENFSFYGDELSTYRDLSPLQNSTKLQTLVLPGHNGGYEGITYNGDSLAAFTNLTELHMPGNIESLEPLRNLTNLHTLNIRYSSRLTKENFQSLSLLSGLPNLQQLEAWGVNEVTDLSPIGELTQLTSLAINISGGEINTPISLAPLANLTNLQTLTLQVRASDLSPLSALTGLQTLTLRYPKLVSDWSPVEHVPTVNKEP
ncbi:MAG: leucine-rich repeat domain-containing protein [Lachnospiraceae bacterium]|nr:leucine-rich repeat domain-containing protein [Lachnospiraceae bacterium]